jgi:hypothetical protein
MRFFVAAAIVLTGFMGIEAAKGAPTPEGKSARVSQENDIREAVFRYQFRHNSSIQGQKLASIAFQSEKRTPTRPMTS